MKKRAIALENIRSIYNVGNIIRTADCLGYDVILLGYTCSNKEKLHKTALGAEEYVDLQSFYNVKKGIEYIKTKYENVIVGEITDNATNLENINIPNNKSLCIILGNELDGVTLETIENVGKTSFIPMKGIKNSLNVCEAGTIFMYKFSKKD